MHPLIARTFGGLTASYYFRHFVFGLIFPALFVFMATQGAEPRPVATGSYVFFTVSSLLYPYSRFVYERVVGFVMGDNVFVVNALLMLFVKLITMAFCWAFAIFVAPVGLLYLYFYHRRAEAQWQSESANQ